MITLLFLRNIYFIHFWCFRIMNTKLSDLYSCSLPYSVPTETPSVDKNTICIRVADLISETLQASSIDILFSMNSLYYVLYL